MHSPNILSSNEAPHPAAVVVLHEKATDALILTQRNIRLRTHPGQICFPGGHWQVGDTTLWKTALRELHEELGVDATRVLCLKQLESEQTLGGSIIHPWLASIQTLIPYSANVHEVSAVLSLPMMDVMAPENYKDVILDIDGEMITSVQFIACDYFVWGATARIMKQLCLSKIAL